MKTTARLSQTCCLGALLMALGCASATPAPTPPPAETTPVARAEPKAQLHASDPGAPALAPIYFDTDRALLREDARDALKRHATAIVEHPEWGVVTVEGHCDDRGSEEYNMALGGRRAAAVARYLADLGVPESRLETRTFGEARPAVAGHGEAAWRQNRRSELQSEARDSAKR